MNISFGNATWFRGKVPNFRMIWRFAWQFIEDSHWQPCLITGGYIIRIYTYMHACIHPYIHPCVHMYIHTYVRTYVHSIPLHWIALHCTALHYITLHLIDFRVPWGSPLEFFSTFHALGIDIFRAEDFTVKCSGSGPRSSAPNGYWNGIRGVPVFLRQTQTNKQGSCCSVYLAPFPAICF